MGAGEECGDSGADAGVRERADAWLGHQQPAAHGERAADVGSSRCVMRDPTCFLVSVSLPRVLVCCRLMWLLAVVFTVFAHTRGDCSCQHDNRP